jgi:hypothetical protein
MAFCEVRVGFACVFSSSQTMLWAKFLIVVIPSLSLRTSPLWRPKAMFQYDEPGTIISLIMKKNMSCAKVKLCPALRAMTMGPPTLRFSGLFSVE